MKFPHFALIFTVREKFVKCTLHKGVDRSLCARTSLCSSAHKIYLHRGDTQMKKISKFAAILTALALALAFTACSHPNSGDDSSSSSSGNSATQTTIYLDGTYEYYSTGSHNSWNRYTFAPEGTISWTSSAGRSGNGTFTVEGDNLSGSFTLGDGTTYTVSGTKTSTTTWSITFDSGEPFTITKQQ